MPDGAVVALDVGVLLGLPGLDVLDGDLPFFGPFHQLATDVFGAVVDPYGAGFPSPLDDPVQAANDPFGGQGKVHLNAQPFPVEVVEHVQQPELAAIAEAISHEVHGPGHVRRVRHRQGIGLLALQPLAWLDPQVQFQRAIDAIDALVVPRMTFDIAQMQEAQAEAPGLAGVGQPDRECQVFCVWVNGSMLPERSKDDDDFQRTAGRVAEGLQAA